MASLDDRPTFNLGELYRERGFEGPVVCPGLEHVFVAGKGAGVPHSAAGMRNMSLGLFVMSLKRDLVERLEAPESTGYPGAMKMLKAYAGALKSAYPGEGETEGAAEFRKYLLQKDGFHWDILSLKEPGKLTPSAGANINVYSAPDGTKVGAIEQGFAKKTMNREEAAKFFTGAVQKLREHGSEFVIMEMNHPGRMDEAMKRQDDKRTPYRVDNALYMADFGVRAANTNYGQITLNAGDDPVLHLALGILPTDPSVTSIPSEKYLDIVKGYFSTFQIVRDEAEKSGKKPGDLVEGDPTFQSIKAKLAGQATVELVDPRTDWKLSARDSARWQPQ